jgi:phosphoserine phosphatase RsbX
MTATAINHTSTVEWSVVSRALPGQAVSGDLHVIAPWRDGVLIGVIDGLGHGDEAVAAARVAADVLEQHAGETVVSLVQRCHRALQKTRGVVMTLVSADTREETIAALGIGNVETLLLRANPRATPRRDSVLLRNGVVGYRLPALQVSVLPVARGDVIVFATDGVREDFGDIVQATDTPAQITARVMGEKFRGTDDGLVLACKYTGKRET